MRGIVTGRRRGEEEEKRQDRGNSLQLHEQVPAFHPRDRGRQRPEIPPGHEGSAGKNPRQVTFLIKKY